MIKICVLVLSLVGADEAPQESFAELPDLPEEIQNRSLAEAEDLTPSEDIQDRSLEQLDDDSSQPEQALTQPEGFLARSLSDVAPARFLSGACNSWCFSDNNCGQGCSKCKFNGAWKTCQADSRPKAQCDSQCDRDNDCFDFGNNNGCGFCKFEISFGFKACRRKHYPKQCDAQCDRDDQCDGYGSHDPHSCSVCKWSGQFGRRVCSRRQQSKCQCDDVCTRDQDCEGYGSHDPHRCSVCKYSPSRGAKVCKKAYVPKPKCQCDETCSRDQDCEGYGSNDPYRCSICKYSFSHGGKICKKPYTPKPKCQCDETCSRDDECAGYGSNDPHKCSVCKYSSSHRGKVCRNTYTPKPDDGDWKFCSNEWDECHCKGEVRYGHGDRWNEKSCDESIYCSSWVFGDPYPSQSKQCQCRVKHHKPVYNNGFVGCYQMLIIGTGGVGAPKTKPGNQNKVGWQRQDPVPNNALSAPFCALRCKDLGFKLFALECPRKTGVECMCAHDAGFNAADDKKCECFNEKGPSRCVGPFTQHFTGEKYALGAGNYIAAYRVDNKWLRNWLNEQLDAALISDAPKQTIVAMFIMLAYQLM